MKQLLTAGIALTALVAAPAMAADMRVKAPVYKAPPPVAVFSWTGCYVGGNVGWIGGDDRYDLTMAGSFLLPTNLFSNPANSALLNHSYRSDESGVTGGIGVGCNYQVGWFVLGVEADFNGSSLRETINAAYGPAGPFIGSALLASSHAETVTKDLPWFATFRARLGVTFDRLLIYGTGGLAVGRIKSSTLVSFGADQFFLSGFAFTGSDAVTRTGWTAGVGAEWALTDNWSIKAEYLHLNFGSFSYLSPCTVLPACAVAVGAPPFAWQTDIRARENIVRVGVNYRFGGPVMAKY